MYCSLPIALTLAHYNDEIDVTFAYPGWSSTFFCFKFTLSCVIGFVLMYSLLLCTHYNSSLTTTVTGCMKNICITYIGMVLPRSDYVFSFINFIGINISVAGSLIYSYVVFKTKKQTPKSWYLNYFKLVFCCHFEITKQTHSLCYHYTSKEIAVKIKVFTLLSLNELK